MVAPPRRVEGARTVDGSERRPPRVGKPQTVFHTSHTRHQVFSSQKNQDQNLSVSAVSYPQILRRRH
jgi:hypothetical protein